MLFSLSLGNLVAQESGGKAPKKSLELGVGASIFQFSRVDFTNFQNLDEGYRFNVQLRNHVLGPHLYIAAELNPYLYLDLQGNMGFTSQWNGSENVGKNLFMVGPGLQFRLGEYFNSPYIDPFLRVGVNYLYKSFDMRYTGVEGNLPEEMEWFFENMNRPGSVDLNSMVPISLGAGVNMWLNDRWGLGLQGDYLVMPHKGVANSIQGTVRVLFRIGGKSKRPTPVVNYVNVEKVVEGPVRYVDKIVEKLVEVPVEPVSQPTLAEVCELFNNIYFDFDKATIKPESHEVLDKISAIMLSDLGKRYLITGYTDSRGSDEYNISLSRRRAAAVVSELELRGVPVEMIKSRGVGKRVAYAAVSATHDVREGDRKVVAEIISNSSYWDYIPKRDY